MRKFFIPLLIIITLAACHKKSDATLITGNITGMGNDTIYLYSFDDSSDVIDTIFVEDDRFAYSLNTDTLTANILLFSDGSEFPLFIDKNIEISINGDSASLQRLKVHGGLANETYARFVDNIIAADTSGQSIEKVAEDFILNNRTSTVSIYLLDRYFVQSTNPDFSQIKKLIESMAGTLQDDSRIATFNEIVTQSEKAATGRIIPFFSLINKDGEKITRNDNYKDKFLVINFWSSWNDSSRIDNQQMRKIYKKYRKNKDVGLLSISLDINKENWLEAIDQDTLSWEQVSDLSGMNSSVLNTLAIYNIPNTILVGKNGRILARDVSPDSIAKLIESELKKEEKKAAEAKKKKK